MAKLRQPAKTLRSFHTLRYFTDPSGSKRTKDIIHHRAGRLEHPENSTISYPFMFHHRSTPKNSRSWRDIYRSSLGKAYPCSLELQSKLSTDTAPGQISKNEYIYRLYIIFCEVKITFSVSLGILNHSPDLDLNFRIRN